MTSAEPARVRYPAVPAGGAWEILALVLLLAVGLAPRLVFVSMFPTVPVSDFNGLVDFALAFAGGTWSQNDHRWELHNPGLPAMLSLVLRLSSGAPDQTARIATATLCGLIPLLPFLLWRGVLPLWVRLTAGGALALWPGQIFLSGVIAQDNWVLLPTVALGALTVRACVGETRYPVTAGLLYGLGVAVRQDMLIPLVPLLLGAGLGTRKGRRTAAAVLAAVSVAALLGLAVSRMAATGRFALTSEHSGLAMLGAYVPGATANYWVDPAPYIASVEPNLLRNRRAMQEAGFRLVLLEASRRPTFHVLRMSSSIVKFAVDGEVSSLYWSLGAEEVLPASHRARADALITRSIPLLRWELAAVQGLFLAAVVIGLRRRNSAILLLASAVILKVGFHALVVIQGRYLLPATSLEMLAISLAAWEAMRRREAGLVKTALVLGAVGAVCLLVAAPRLEAMVQARDHEEQRTYRFPLTESPGAGTLDCILDRGRLTALSAVSATFELLAVDPMPGDRAETRCVYTSQAGPPMVLQILDPYDRGGWPDRIRIEVDVDGAEALRHDVAAQPWSGWLEVPLGQPALGTSRVVRIAIIAVRPDPGAAWGRAARITFRLSRKS